MPSAVGFQTASEIRAVVHRLWHGLRKITGDDAYERYLAHWRTHHADDGSTPLDRKAFYKAEQMRKWNGMRRCC
jgi:Uncharacterized small protein